MIIDYLHRTLLSNFEKINRFLSNVIDYRLTTPGGKDSKNIVDLLFEYLSFSNKRKTTMLFPSPLTFLFWPMVISFSPTSFHCRQLI